MKKIILTLALVLVTSLSFANQTHENKSLENENKDCFEYAIKSATDEAIYYNDDDLFHWIDSFLWYQDACNEVGGYIEDPVFL